MGEKVFLLGDNISIQYGPYLERIINGDFQYYRKTGLENNVVFNNIANGENGGNSRQVISFLKEMKFNGKRYDIIIINCGLHDIKRDRKSKEINTELDEYQKNLINIAKIASEICHEMIWIQTTFVYEEIHNTRGFGCFRFNEDIKRYNLAAEKIMKSRGVHIIDFSDFMRFNKESYRDHIHFVDEIRISQAEKIATYLYSRLRPEGASGY